MFKFVAMKRAVLLLACLYGMTASAQEPVQGYFIAGIADTVACTISLPWGRKGTIDEGRLSEARFITADNKNVRYNTKNLKGFGFRHEGRSYRYVAKALPGSGKVVFVRVVVEGPYMNCYQYQKAHGGNRMSGAGVPYLGPSIVRERFFILEGSDHRLLLLDEFSFADRGQKFKKFFAGKPEQESLYEALVKEFVDVAYFASVLNSK
jgi:hypothetical protein